MTDIRKATRGVEHSEIAKASLLLAKIAFSRGELKHAFEILKQADDMLQRALIKDRNSAQYIRVYQHSDCYLEIGFVRSRVYNKQMSHDLALQHLDIV